MRRRVFRTVPALIATLAVLAVLAPPAPAGAVAPSSLPSLPSPPGSCDPIAASECLLPFPNDWYTRPDPHTPTGRRLALNPLTLPRATLGLPVDPVPWNRADGFSPGSPLIANVPGLDLTASGAAPITDIGRSLAADAPIVIIEADTGTRWPYWAELDANATDPARTALLVHPARNFRDGHRYLVALRGLKDTAGQPIPAAAAFAGAAGPDLPGWHPLAARQRALRPVLRQLAHNGVAPVGLHLAWDFTVASTAGLTGDLHAIRDDAFAGLGDRSPGFAVTGVKDFTAEQDSLIAREVSGFVGTPSYLNLPGGPAGSAFARGPDGRPRHLPGNIQPTAFRCEIPRAAFDAPARPALYGHGLLGSRDEVGAGNVKAMAAEHDFTFCATEWIGMAAEDIPNVLGALLDINRFASIPERSQQGMLNAQFLGRALIHPAGLATDPAFRGPGGQSLVDTKAGLSYDGNSQGGILGGALVATSPDITRGVLGVTAMNYNLLLNRSADFRQFQPIIDTSYPDKLRQQVVLSLYQLLWDRGETNGYASELAGRQVLMHIAYGDHQVANVAAEVQARTIGARLVTPALTQGRSPDLVPYWGIQPAGPLPYQGSALVVWDSGTPSPPLTNTPPSGQEYGNDPHSDPRNMATARQQKATFLSTGQVVDVCGGNPCTAVPVP